jgi:hypothetical protein
MALAGGALPETVCSHLGGAGGGAHQLLSFLDYEDACRLREACKELHEMVRDCVAWHRLRRQQWPHSLRMQDRPPHSTAGELIVGSQASWRSANPQALRANVFGRRGLLDADFVHLRGIKVLDLRSCRQAGITKMRPSRASRASTH